MEDASILPSIEDLTTSITPVSSSIVNPHPDFQRLKEDAWDAFMAKDYETTARLSARILQDSFALDAIHLAGLSLTGLDRGEEGFDWMCASLSLATASAEWYANAAIACMDKKDYLHAMLFIQNGLKDHPTNVRLSYMSGLCMCHAQQWEKALEFLDQTLVIDPDFYHAKMSKGFCLHMMGRYEEAIANYEDIRDQAFGADREEVVNNHACVLLEQAKPEASLAMLNEHYPDSQRPGTLYNKSFLYLGLGMWPEAWELYRYRTTVQVNGEGGIPNVQQPIGKTLDELRGKDLFLFHEQGLGDSLQFIRYAKLLRPYVKSLTIGVPAALKRLVRTMDLGMPYHVVADATTDKSFTKCDIAVPMLDCPSLFGTTVETIPNYVPYFHVPKEAIDKNQLRDTCFPQIGLCWAGASRPENMRAHNIDKRRSVPFEMLEPLLQMHKQFEFVSLQLPDRRVDDPRVLQPICPDLEGVKVDLATDHPDHIVRSLADKFDCLDTAAIIQQLDLVITIDSAVAHIAGALGVPVWMFSRYDQCWRWFWDGRTDTPWYPTMRIYRQKAHDTWPEVIERVCADLKAMREMDFLACRLTT